MLALAAIQIASDAIFSSAAAPYSVAAAVPLPVGTAIYRIVSRLGPAPYVEDMLARAALREHNLQSAQRYARRLPLSAARSELFARIAEQRGDQRGALQAYLRAGDVAAINRQVAALAAHDPRAAYALELRLNKHLAQSATHPDAVAESLWQLGVLAAEQGRPMLAMTNYRRAIALSPISGKYLIAAGFQALALSALPEAAHDFSRAVEVDPASADAYAGAGLVALRMGDRTSAMRDAARSRWLNPSSHALATLQAAL